MVPKIIVMNGSPLFTSVKTDRNLKHKTFQRPENIVYVSVYEIRCSYSAPCSDINRQTAGALLLVPGQILLMIALTPVSEIGVVL
jgi:hypothetical protein